MISYNKFLNTDSAFPKRGHDRRAKPEQVNKWTNERRLSNNNNNLQQLQLPHPQNEMNIHKKLFLRT
jgi:hypothetical protein